MATPPSPPPSMNSSACPFKTNIPSPKPRGAPAVGASPVSSGPRHIVVYVRDIVNKLRAGGHLSGLDTPDAELTEEGTSALFEGVLEAFLAEVRASAGLPLLPKPLMIGKDGPVEMQMLRLHLAVRSSGGYAAVTSWAAIAEVVGLEPVAAAPLKLLYFKYLLPLEQSIGNCKPEMQDQEVAGGCRDAVAARRSNGKKDQASLRSSGHLKRKRGAPVPLQMLNWVRLVAKSPLEHGNGICSQFSSTLMLRRLRFANVDCSQLAQSTTSQQSGLTMRGRQMDGMIGCVLVGIVTGFCMHKLDLVV
ncbi:uncharacterized protein LOC123429243 isoform X1 [Hordeum vulgare subsp. vulgare]|uniref:uncharacterized protein LOC123429243 isoform X1 n=1 Tax=Hordeum vulgare subsp. vulgare TaxID=112509 RepID=UPI001D1A5AD2|nr:uncharacterized protein LOC123429243 isoform X1 [Hordeum vulgare subsp. vulgare]